jgi:Concanavalin A-like lectin/glucanases superfamily/Immunoglobulin domain/Fibronectin type III domain
MRKAGIMMCQLKKIAVRRVALVLFLLSGVAMVFPASALATQSVTFAWDPSADPNVVGYNIYYGTTTHVYTSKVSVGNVTTATISGLVEGTTYYFAATTYDALNQESALSDEISYSVPVTATNQPPVITEMLTTNMAIAGQNVTFSITATGTGSLEYQWTYNQSNIPSATNAVLTLNNVTVAQAGTYYVTVSNSAGSTNSSTASLTVYPTTAATLTPASHVNGQFALSVSGVTNYQYVVQASTNLVDWVSMQTDSCPFTFVDSNASQFRQRFYRTYYLPINLPANSFTDITNGLVDWHPLAGDVNDHSGNGNNGMAAGSPSYTTGVLGVANTAMSFDGASQYVDCGNGNSLNIVGQITVSAWINSATFPPTNGTFQAFCEKGYDGANEAYFMRFHNSSSVTLDAGSYNGTDHAVSIANPNSTHVWYFMVETYDGTSWNLYVNGIFAASSPQSFGAIKSSADFCIGAAIIAGTPGRYFNGSIAGARIYNRALSGSEIGMLYTNGISGGIF